MREIKFRAWLKEEMEMTYNIGVYEQFIVEYMQHSTSDTGVLSLRSGRGQFQYSEINLMQYTGLKDKNGKEIYEGDVAKRGISLFKVVFAYSQWNFVSFGRSISYPSFYSNAETMKIIGNIYENPELLEKEKAK